MLCSMSSSTIRSGDLVAMTRRHHPPVPLSVRDDDFLDYSGPLFRLHHTSGAHPSRWDELRHIGPLRGMRWDPHPPSPECSRQTAGVLYAAGDIVTAFGEVFQAERVIRRTPDRELAGWLPSRPLRLLDLTDAFFVRNSALASIAHGPKKLSREWARAIHDQLGADVDGLCCRSAVTNRLTFALTERCVAVPAFPPAPKLAQLLSAPALVSTLVRVADELGYGLS